MAMYRILYFAMMALSFLICVPLRALELTEAMDYQTGLYRSFTVITPVLFGIIVAAVAVLAFLLLRRRHTDASLQGTSTAMGAFQIGLGLFFGGSTALDALGYTLVYTSSQRPNAASLIFSAVCCVSLLLSGGLLIMKKRAGNIGRIAIAVPVLWTLFRLVEIFIGTIAVSSFSDRILHVFFYIFLALFLFFHAKSVAGIDAGGSARSAFGFGCCAVLVGSVFSLSKFAASFLQPDLGFFSPPGLMDLGLLGYTVLACGFYAFTIRESREEKSETYPL